MESRKYRNAATEDAPTSAVRAVFGDAVTMSGCWFHYGQAPMKRLKKLCLTDAYNSDDTTQVVFRCLLSLPKLPLLPVVAILPGSKGFDDGGRDVKGSTGAALS